ncbi:MAG: hypothetical protein FWH11_11080 [Micrococcales bacterium]|nr:hypothetical protein [Micrococcales bacterium]
MLDSGEGWFVGRSRLMGSLREHLDATSQRGRILAVRGRRQVGKSTALERFVEGCGVPYLYATGVYRGSARQHLDGLAAAAHQSRVPLPGADELFAAPPASWRDALGKIGLAARSGPVVVVLDEFPWFVGTDPSLEGELQAVWDRVWEKLPVLLVLIGSDVAMMDRLTGYGRPLFGRVRDVRLGALDPGEVAQALPHADAQEVLDAYLITGGYPRLVQDLVGSGRPTRDWAARCFADPFSPLLATGRFIMDAEFPDSPAASHVLAVIGSQDSGRPGFTDIVSAVADPDERKSTETAVTRALGLLSGPKELIERELPAWAAPKTRLRRYRVADPYLRFWFRYVDQQADLVWRGRPDLPLARFEQDWPTWRGHSVEPVVRQSLLRLAVDHPELGGVEQVAPWWTRDGQTEIDVVATTRATTAVVGTIKWRYSGGVTRHELVRLAHAASLVPHAADARLAAVFPAGDAPAEADLVFRAEDLLAAWRP